MTTRWSVPFDDPEAVNEFVDALNSEVPKPLFPGMRVAEQVFQYNGVKFEIYADEHPPPHFHIVAGDQSASSHLSDGTLYKENRHGRWRRRSRSGTRRIAAC